MQPQPVLCSHATNPYTHSPKSAFTPCLRYFNLDVFMRVVTIGYTQENVRCQLLASVGRAQARQIRELVHKISKGKKFYAPCTKSCTKFLLFKFCSPLAKCVLLHFAQYPSLNRRVMVGIEVHCVPLYRGESLRWLTQNLSP